MTRILLIEDDKSIAVVISSALEAEGMTVDQFASLRERDQALQTQHYDALITDVMLEDGDGIDDLPTICARYPDVPVIILSAQNSLDTAVRATDTGAYEYFPKPFDLDELVRAVCQAVGARQSSAKPDAQDGAVETSLPLVGRSQPMQAVFRMITRVLKNDLTVLILGESGTGKELVAEAIHTLGHRRDAPFIAVNMAAIPAELIESELFGHEKGAFTGAVARKIGMFEQAKNGTLFLDEIGDMPLQAQTRLLRALQSGAITRVGGSQDIRLNVRIIAATNKPLAGMIADGRFREDLFYRLNVVPIDLPPLRARPEDVAPLARHFLRQAEQEGLPRHQLTDAALNRLSQQSWPGNVRELRNFIYRIAVLARDELIDELTLDQLAGEHKSDMSLHQTNNTSTASFASVIESWINAHSPAEGAIYQSALAAFERPLLEMILGQTGGNQLKAARLLGINRNTLHKKLIELGLASRSEI